MQFMLLLCILRLGILAQLQPIDHMHLRVAYFSPSPSSTGILYRYTEDLLALDSCRQPGPRLPSP